MDLLVEQWMPPSLLFPATQSHLCTLCLSQEISSLISLCGLSLPLLPIGHCHPDRNAWQIPSPEVTIFFSTCSFEGGGIIFGFCWTSQFAVCLLLIFIFLSWRVAFYGFLCISILPARRWPVLFLWWAPSQLTATAVEQIGTKLLKIIHRAPFHTCP